MEQLLITQDDLRKFRPSAEFSEARITPYILEAQELDIKPFLNSALYLDLTKNLAETKYQELVYGKEYTYNGVDYYFTGLQACLSYYTLARFLPSHPLHITSFGVVQKTTQQSEAVDPTLINNEVKKLLSNAVAYQRETIEFLTRFPETYPLYSSNGRSANAGRRNGLNFFKL
jgi:hypothetical protein